MSAKVVPPSITSKQFNCPHCGAYADQSWHDVYSSLIGNHGTPSLLTAERAHKAAISKGVTPEVTRQLITDAIRAESGEVFLEVQRPLAAAKLAINLSLSECYSCGNFSIWNRDCVLYPSIQQGVSPNEDMPPEILRDFNEARSIVGISPRGAAALLRLCIQKLCVHFGESGENINADISSLVRKGLDARVQKALDIVRVIGNEAVHPGQIDLSDDQDTANKLFGLVNLIVEKMITEEKHISSMYSALPQEKLRGIQERDKGKGG